VVSHGRMSAWGGGRSQQIYLMEKRGEIGRRGNSKVFGRVARVPAEESAPSCREKQDEFTRGSARRSLARNRAKNNETNQLGPTRRDRFPRSAGVVLSTTGATGKLLLGQTGYLKGKGRSANRRVRAKPGYAGALITQVLAAERRNGCGENPSLRKKDFERGK